MPLRSVGIRHHPSETRLQLIASLTSVSSLAVELLCDGMAEKLESSLSTENLELSRLGANVLLDVRLPKDAIAL